MAPTDQFSGGAPRTSSEHVFLDALAAHIANWTVPDVRVDSFAVIAGMHPLVVLTEVPDMAVSPGKCTLQIGYWDDDRGCRALQGEWGDDHLLDSHESSSDGLTVFGLHEEPALYGVLTGKWLERQLQRRVDRQDWIRKGTLVRSRWVLPDTGMRVAQTVNTNWFVRGAPDRVTRVR